MKRRLIDGNAIHGECNSDNPEFIAGWNALAVEIDQAPTIDAVEVVRCRECEYWKKYADSYPFIGSCKIAGYFVGEKGYCVYGKRREPDGE